MSKIATIGKDIFDIQVRLGLSNPLNWNPGLERSQAMGHEMFLDLGFPSEIHDLFLWRNGTVSLQTIPMTKLWFIPGFYMLQADEVLTTRDCLITGGETWRVPWYPLFTSGSADFWFVDTARVKRGKMPMFYSYPESKEPLGQIYDSIEKMFETVLECYKRTAYYVNPQGHLETNYNLEAAISRACNPDSNYWYRPDLL